MPNCYILRGLPGSGKSTVARQLNCFIVSADDYFNRTGKYIFEKYLLGRAHDYCFEWFVYRIERREDVVVDNTNTTKKEYQRYYDYAKERDYKVTILTIETDLTDEELAKRNIHGVPVETIRRMRERMKHG